MDQGNKAKFLFKLSNAEKTQLKRLRAEKKRERGEEKLSFLFKLKKSEKSQVKKQYAPTKLSPKETANITQDPDKTSPTALAETLPEQKNDILQTGEAAIPAKKKSRKKIIAFAMLITAGLFIVVVALFLIFWNNSYSYDYIFHTLTIYSDDYYNDEVQKNILFKKTEVENIVINDGVHSIAGYAFEGFTNLKYVTIPESVGTIGDRAFSQCENLKAITIPDGVTAIGDYTFFNCKRIESITIPESVVSIGKNAFANCKLLENINIPYNATSIDSYAFYNCISIKSIKLFENVTYIGDWAFADWTINQKIRIIGRSSAPSGWSSNWNKKCYAEIKWNDLAQDGNK